MCRPLDVGRVGMETPMPALEARERVRTPVDGRKAARSQGRPPEDAASPAIPRRGKERTMATATKYRSVERRVIGAELPQQQQERRGLLFGATYGALVLLA